MSISCKKLVSLILVWILTISLLPVTASAQENGEARQKVKQVQHIPRKLQQEFSNQDTFWAGY